MRIDFVEQLDALIPDQGTKATRGILQRLADTPDLQHAFFGGPVVDLAPIGVFEQDGPRRYEAAIKTRPWEEYEQGRKRPDDGSIRDAAWRQDRDGGNQNDRTQPYQQETEEERQKGNVLRSADAEAGAPTTSDGLLDPTTWPGHLRGDKSEETGNADTANPQEAQARPQRNPENIDRYFDDLDKRVQELAKRWNTDPNFIHALFSMESGWFDQRARERNNPFGYTVQPNSDAHRAGQRPGEPTRISSLDRAFQQWSDKWGSRIRESENLHDFLENIQRGGTGMYNEAHSVHNANRPKIDPYTDKRIKSYEEKVEEQYRTVLKRRQLWEQNRR